MKKNLNGVFVFFEKRTKPVSSKKKKQKIRIKKIKKHMGWVFVKKNGFFLTLLIF